MSDTLVEIPQKHAPYGPSQADAYTACLDYVNANAGLPDLDLKVGAEGTAAHVISDLCLKTGMDAIDFLGHRSAINEWLFVWDQDDAGLLQPGLDRFRAIPGDRFTEQRVDVSEWTTENQFGTLDRAALGKDFIFLEDLKWGRGIAVNPVRNKQISLYALGLWKLLGKPPITRFIMSIDQPRNMGGGGVWETTIDELQRIGEWVQERVAMSQRPGAPRTAGNRQCAFCRRKIAPGGCEEYERFMLELVGDRFADPAISTEDRAHILLHKKMIETWLDQLEAAALEDALAGRPTGALKAVKGRRGNAKFLNEKLAEAAIVPLLGDKAWRKSLVTPTQASKLIDHGVFQEKVAPFVQFGEHSTVLAPLEDARPALSPVETKMDEENDG